MMNDKSRAVIGHNRHHITIQKIGSLRKRGSTPHQGWILSFSKAIKCVFGTLSVITILICLLILPLLNAYRSSDSRNLNQYICDVKHQPSKAVFSMPGHKIPAEYSYPEDAQHASPFKKTFATLGHESLDALHFVGVLREGPRIWALISQPGGLISTVKVGDYVGEEHGRIFLIKDDAIQIETIVRSDRGMEKKLITLNLRF